MKKLNKLKINPEKVMKNEELVSLRGGYGDPCTCLCMNSLTSYIYGYLLSENGDCVIDCRYAFGDYLGQTGWCVS